MPDVRNEIIDNLQVRGSVSGGSLGNLATAIRVAMTASTTVGGAQIPTSTNAELGTSNFSLRIKGALADWTPSSVIRIVQKYVSLSDRIVWYIDTNGTLVFLAVIGGVTIINATSTVANTITNGTAAEIGIDVTRETAGTAGSVVFSVNGVQLGASVAIAAASTVSLNPSSPWYWFGGSSPTINRDAGDFYDFKIYNRALSAAEVLSLYNNGPALADLGASQTVFYAGNYSAGVDGVTTTAGTTLTGNIDSIDGENDWLRVERTGATGNNYCLLPTTGLLDKRVRTSVKIHNATGSGVSYFYIFYGGSPPIAAQQVIVAIPAGTTKTIELDAVLTRATTVAVAPTDVSGNNITVATGSIYYVKSVLIYKSGLTGWWDARDAQSDTGQILDSSGNKNHAMLPASGATVIGKPMSEARQVRWTNTWTGTQELQYIGGVNQAVLPAKAYIESIVGIVSGATVEDIIIGDGSSGNRYVTITTGLAAGTVTFTLANRTTDGTNLKLTVDPDANATMSIIWTVTYRILE